MEQARAPAPCPGPSPRPWQGSPSQQPWRPRSVTGGRHPRTFPALPAVPLGPSPPALAGWALPQPQPGFLLGKLPALHAAAAERSCRRATDGALPLVPHIPAVSPPCWHTHRGTFMPTSEMSVIKYGGPRPIETPSLGPAVMGGITLFPLCLPTVRFRGISCLWPLGQPLRRAESQCPGQRPSRHRLPTAKPPPLTGTPWTRRLGICLQTGPSTRDELGRAAARLCPLSHLPPAADSSVMKRNAPTLP